ncbi:MAG: exodeoxyribonuclease V subunit gamma, partial [Gammaproteobacteria bacterium]|nr:exodeoxyribonuclease V subunit gamma [Gammaproteobacteria bacterium]
MTLHIFHSNKVEHLHHTLSTVLEANPLTDPFTAEVIICPSQTLARWLNIEFAKKQGIAAHYEYPLPATWVWKLASKLIEGIPDKDNLDRECMSWQLFYYLAECDENKALYPIQNYLQNDKDGIKRWSLAQKIALVFERYKHYRPDIIQRWNSADYQAKDNEAWQCYLWQQLKKQAEVDRVQLMYQLINYLSTHSEIKHLPERISFFSISALPPLMLNVIQSLALHTDVFFYALSPSDQYWGDLISLKQQAKQRLDSPELNSYFSSCHELLASWGRQGQIFQDMLLTEIDNNQCQSMELYGKQETTTLLHKIQHSLYSIDDAQQPLEGDDSIQINQCYSPLRECEVLHDQCLSLLENKSITPEDILVVVPNIELYAASIETVFKKNSQLPHQPFIPWNISDSSLRSENTLIHTFLKLLTLPQQRLSISDVLEFLECSELLNCFDLSEADKPVINEYIKAGHINWGLDENHKSEFDVPKTIENTWINASVRFFTAYAVDDKTSWNEITPLAGFSSSRADILAYFLLFIDTLNEWRTSLKRDRNLTDWQLALNNLLDAFFKLFVDTTPLQMIRDQIAGLVEDAQFKSTDVGPKPIQFSLAFISHCLKQRFETIPNQRFFSGGITFCGMRPMRSVPFKVIVMLGMNEHDFPRKQNTLEFDLMSAEWRPGDLLLGDEDRYLFLEALLCAREKLIISYCAFNQKDNSTLEPSLLVSELREYCDSHFNLITDVEKPLSETLTYQYPLHVFSAANFISSPPSYKHYWGEVALGLQNKPTRDQDDLNIIVEPFSEINLKQLIRCLKDPIKFFFSSQLKINIYEESENEDHEIFSLNGLQSWQIKNEMIQSRVHQQSLNFKQFSSLGVLPHANHAFNAFQKLAEDVEKQLHNYEHYLESEPSSETIDLNLTDNIKLYGQVAEYYNNKGLFQVSPSSFSGNNFMPFWLLHCCCCAQGLIDKNQKSI